MEIKTPIFTDSHQPTTEWENGHDIKVYRYPNGDVEIVVGRWSERTDKEYSVHVISSGAADALGSKLLCMNDDTFDAITSRSCV